MRGPRSGSARGASMGSCGIVGASRGGAQASAAVAAGLLYLATAIGPVHAADPACPPPPQPIADLDIPAFYANAKAGTHEPDQRKRHDDAVRPLITYLAQVTATADRAVLAADGTDRRVAAACAVTWLAAWARGNAWLGRMSSAQSEYQRKWDLAGASLAWLKVRPLAPAEERERIDRWLERWADAALAVFDDPRVERNNHWYWLGPGLAATALATGSERHRTAARRIMADAARDIGPDGTLKRELARGGRAIHYHAFAVMPLVVLAELGAAMGDGDWYALNDSALHRLVEVTSKGLAEPALFAKLAGVPQQPNPGTGAGWAQLYERRFPGRVTLPAMKSADRWLGGDVTALLRVLSSLPGRRP